MTDSKDIVQSAAVSHSSASKAAKSRSIYGLLLLWLVALFIAAAACAGGFLLDRKFSHAYVQLAQRQQAAERAFAEIQSNVQAQHALDAQQTQLAEQLSEVQNRLQALENASQHSERGNEAWKAAEIEQMLATANEQLRLTGNTSLALFALQYATAQLAADPSARAQTARKAVERDIQVLQTTPSTEWAAKFELALTQVDRLPLASEPQTPESGSVSLPPTTENRANAPLWKRGWERLSTGIAQQWSNLVRVRQIERDDALLLTPEQGALVREHLKLRLLSARLALLARNPVALKADVQAAAHALRYFDTTAPAAQAVNHILLEVEQAAQAATTLNIDASVQAVHQYQNRS